MRTTWMLIPALVMTGLTSAAIAQEESSFRLGLAVGHQSSIYRDVDGENTALPFVAYNNGNFFIRGPEAGYFFYGDESSLRIGGLVRYRMGGYDAGDSDYLTGMDDREGTLEAGVIATYPTAFGKFSAAALTDVANKHDGYELILGWNKPLFLSDNWILTPQTNLSYRSDHLNDYYVGVTEEESRWYRPAYKAKGGYAYSAGVSLTYIINKNNMLILGSTVEGYDSNVTDSPIVAKNGRVRTGLVYSYQF
jgi:outer membrane protein